MNEKSTFKKNGKALWLCLIALLFVCHSGWSQYSNLWTSPTELASIDHSSGPALDAWNEMKSAADGALNLPLSSFKVSDQDSNANVDLMAAAIVYARYIGLGNTSAAQPYKDKVEDAIDKLVSDGYPVPSGSGSNANRTLAWGREVGAYALAADLVNYRSSAIEAWFRNMADVYLGTQLNLPLRGMFEKRPNNWGSHGFGSLVALYAYLGDTQALTEVRDYWILKISGPKPANVVYGADKSWHVDQNNLRMINPKDGVKNGMNLDGVVPDDQRRSASFVDPPVPTHYAWEVLQGWVSGARIYERIGMPIWNVYDDALHRVVYKQHIDWYNQYGYLVPSNETSDTFEARGDDVWMLPIIDGAYGTNYSDYSKLSSHQESKIWDHGKNAGWSYVTFGDSSTGGGGSQTADFNPTDDSFVRGGSNADTNYDDDGTAQYLRVKNGNGEENDRESFLRFDIGGLTGTVSSATLKLYVDGLVNGTPAGASVYSVSVDSWDETTLTWNNKPGAITFQSKNASISSTGQYVNFDVTNFVSSEVAGGKSIISLALQDDDQLSKAVDFQRREDGNPPILSINYDGPPVNPQYDLSVSVNGSGSVSPSSGTYDDGTGVTLTATADVGWEFTGWSGDLSGSTNPAQVTMDADKNITATFTETNQTTNLTVSAVSASADDGNIPANTIDNDLGTRWSANGTGQWIKYDLASAYLVEYLEVAWFNGDQRQQYFNIEISADDVSWVQIWSGQSSGTSLALEQIDVADHTARYVRLVCNGNSSNAWNSMTELDIYGKTPPSSVELSPTSVTASADDGNVPTNTTDNDLVTRWSAQGDGQWIQYDYGQSHTFDKVSIAWHLGDVRQTTFDVEISSDASNWTQVFAGSSSGTTLAQEDISFSSTAGRYIRVVGHGNSSNDWNSMTEFDAYGYASAGRSRQSDPLTKSVEPVSALEVYPNPIENDLAIKYRAEQAGMVSIKIFSLEGQQVFNQQWHVGLGENLLELNVGGFNVHGQRSGWYAVHLTGFGQVETRKIIVK